MIDFSRPAAAVLALSIVAFAFGGFFLLGDVDFGGCTVTGGSRRMRWIQDLSCSPHLLGRGWRELIVFLWLWSWPLLFLSAFLALRRAGQRS